jgi:hypothetical protein
MQQIAIEILYRVLTLRDDRSIWVQNIVGVRDVKATDNNIVLLIRVAEMHFHHITSGASARTSSSHVPIQVR